MNVVTKKRILQAGTSHPEWKAGLNGWFKIASAAKWANFVEVRQTFNSADSVGPCVVFDIAHNRCRVISYIRYTAERLYVLQILDHPDYTKGGWINECNCS